MKLAIHVFHVALIAVDLKHVLLLLLLILLVRFNTLHHALLPSLCKDLCMSYLTLACQVSRSLKSVDCNNLHVFVFLKLILVAGYLKSFGGYMNVLGPIKGGISYLSLEWNVLKIRNIQVFHL